MADIGYNNAEYLVEKFLDDIVRFSLVYVRNMDDAQDIAQNVFITYLKKKPVFDSEQHAKNWFYKVTSNLSKNFLRSRRQNVNIDELENVLAAEDTEYDYKSEQDSAVLRTLLSLKRPYREILHLYYYMDYDTNDISRLLGLPASTVRTRLSRARAALEKNLKGEMCFEGKLQKSDDLYSC